MAQRRATPKGQVTFHVVWRELPSEVLLIEAGVRTLVDHLERRSERRRRSEKGPIGAVNE